MKASAGSRPGAPPGLLFPALSRGSAELALLDQLEETQWWSAERLENAQFTQLRVLLRHARATVPHYRERLAGSDADAVLTPALWSALPILSRRQIQDAGNDLRSRRVPHGHGRLFSTPTSGSTGEPVKIYVTGLNHLMWRTLILREHLWQRRDLQAKLCSIRPVRGGKAAPPDGLERRGWGPATDKLGGRGAMALLALGAEVGAQADWLLRHDPEYLLSFPTNLRALADHFIAAGLKLPRLREVRAIGETVSPELSQRVLAAWGVRLTDQYSSQEAGAIALQCPSGSGLYHLQSESVKVEVLDDAGRPCTPGETGRVIVSTLHNFAMPLLRYEIGDYAEAGPSCPCGRGLGTLARVLGRKRNMLTLPDGAKRWPLTGFMAFRGIAPVRQYQFVQHDRRSIEARFVVDRPLAADEEKKLGEVIRGALGHPFDLRFTYLDAFPPHPGGKFEDFVSRVEAA